MSEQNMTPARGGRSFPGVAVLLEVDPHAIAGQIANLREQTLHAMGKLEIIAIAPDDRPISGFGQDPGEGLRVVSGPDRASVWNDALGLAAGKHLCVVRKGVRLRWDALERLAEVLEARPSAIGATADSFLTDRPRQDFVGHLRCGILHRPAVAGRSLLERLGWEAPVLLRPSAVEGSGFDGSLPGVFVHELLCRAVERGDLVSRREFLFLETIAPGEGVNLGADDRRGPEIEAVRDRHRARLESLAADEGIDVYACLEEPRWANVLTVTFNRLDFTKKTLDALVETAAYPHGIHVVDNASIDGTREYLLDQHRKGVVRKVLLLDRNVGLSRGINIGWRHESEADFLLKLDNDIVFQRRGWLEDIVTASDRVPEAAVLGYSLEPKSYPVTVHNGVPLRVKVDSNVGGGCVFLTNRSRDRFGFFCEDYGLYGEEDGDLGLRVRLAGLLNAYMEDEDVAFHLPSGKAATIDPRTLQATDQLEIELDPEYRRWKDEQRAKLQKNGGILHRNVVAYHQGTRSHWMPAGEFMGILGDLQAFDSIDRWRFEFHPLDGKVSAKHFAQVVQWAREQGLPGEPARAAGFGREWLEVAKILPLPQGIPGVVVGPEGVRLCGDPVVPSGCARAGEIEASIVIPVHGKLDLTRQCIESIGATVDPSSTEIVVVDDASPDGTAAWLSEMEGQGRLRAVLQRENKGFAHSCNAGAQAARGRTIVFLNNDTIARPGWLDALLRELRSATDIGMVGARLLYPDGTIQHAGVAFHHTGVPHHVHRGVPGDDPRVLDTGDAQAVTGACIAMPAGLFRRLGGFSESYRMYVEDIDLCLRVWNSGHRIRYCAESCLTHLESASAPDVARRDAQVREGLARLHADWGGRWPSRLLQRADWPASLRNDEKRRGAVLWHAPIYDPSGYASEARDFLVGIESDGWAPAVRKAGRDSEMFRGQCPEPMRGMLDRMLLRPVQADSISVIQFPASAFQRIPGMAYHVGRTMFETDGLPPEWVARCNLMDEVWVPSRFNLETFRAAGVTVPLVRVPGGVDTARYRPGLDPLPIPGAARGTTFLSIFEWTHRKAWDVLLRAWCEAFAAHDDVRLVLRAYPPNAIEGDPGAWVERRIDECLASLGRDRRSCAPIVVLGRQVSESEMPRLHASADVYLAPSRGEGWGRPHMEAMACGVPVIATRWSGNLEFQDDENSWLLDVEGLEEIDAREEFEFYRGQRWAAPSCAHLVELLRTAAADPVARKAKGARARRDMVEKWDWSRIARVASTRLEEIVRGVAVADSALARRAATSNASVRAEAPPLAAKPRDASGPAGTPKAGGAAGIRWAGPIFNFSGYARLGREAVRGLVEAGIEVGCDAQLNDPAFLEDLERSPAEARFWNERLATKAPSGILVCADIPSDPKGAFDGYAALRRANPGHRAVAGWTMFETDRLPKPWIAPLRALDEVWVPSSFNRGTFAAAGLDPASIHVVPGCVDAAAYAEDRVRPMAIDGDADFTFLSVFQWIRRKGWDVLLDAWSRAFRPDDSVRLVLRCHPFGKADPVAVRIDRWLAGRGLTRKDVAPIVLLQDFLPDHGMPSLFRASDCFVLPTRGEGWGLPYLEAMAAGIPSIATAWGAQMDFLNNGNAWLLDPRGTVSVDAESCRENAYLAADHRWADPSPDDLCLLLRRAFEERSEGRAKGARGREEAAAFWNPSRTAEAIQRRLEALADRSHPRGMPRDAVSNTSPSGPGGQGAPPVRLRWEGSQFLHHSLAHVNRELCLGLAKAGHDMSIIPYEPDEFGPGDDSDLGILATLTGAPLDGPCEVHVRHQWPPNLTPPAEGRWIVIQPWEFGSPPRDWMPSFRDQVDEIWAYTSHVRDVYLRAGIPAERVHVVPLGVDTARFRPQQPPLRRLPVRRGVRFLFVGGTILRKGFDVLLRAWEAAFGPEDPVELLIKDMGGKSTYQGQTGQEAVRRLQESGRCAPILYRDDELAPTELPGLYASADVLVHPYRGEGFGLPIAEAMACGLPVIVTEGGAADDFCGNDSGWKVPARRVPVPGGRVGPIETVAPPTWLEPDVDALVAALREAATRPDLRVGRGEAARKRIESEFTWAHAVARAEERLRAVVQRPARRFAAAPPVRVPADEAASGGQSFSASTGGRLEELLGQVEVAAGRSEWLQAESLTRQAVDIAPHSVLAWVARSMILRATGKFAQAVSAIRKGLECDDSPMALLEAVEAYHASGDQGNALRLARRLKERHPDWVHAQRANYKAAGRPWTPDLVKTGRPDPKGAGKGGAKVKRR